jgi:hypothetical protein
MLTATVSKFSEKATRRLPLRKRLMDFHPLKLSRGYAREDQPKDAASAR